MAALGLPTFKRRKKIKASLLALAASFLCFLGGKISLALQRTAQKGISVVVTSAQAADQLTVQDSTSVEMPTAKSAAQENAATAEQRKKFIEDGWTFVEAPAPDPRITQFDPSALSSHETEIQTQLQSTTPIGELLDKVQILARRANDFKTRYVALEALGRSSDPRAQRLLIELYQELPDLGERAQILGFLQPQNLNDGTAAFLLDQIQNDGVPVLLKKRAISSLFALHLVKEGSLSPQFLQKFPKVWHERLENMSNLARRGVGGGHRH